MTVDTRGLLNSDGSIGYSWEKCRCCGGPVGVFDGHPIHTRCIPKHWGKHSRKEFGTMENKTGEMN